MAYGMDHISQGCKLKDLHHITAQFPLTVAVEEDFVAPLHILQLPTTCWASLIPFEAIENQFCVRFFDCQLPPPAVHCHADVRRPKMLTSEDADVRRCWRPTIYGPMEAGRQDQESEPKVKERMHDAES